MIPAALAPLAAYRQFIVVMLVWRAGETKPDKLPVDARTGRVTEKGAGGAHDPAIWLSYDEADAICAQWGRDRFVVGFVLTDADPMWCLDIDGAWDGERWSQLTLDLMAALPRTAFEVSASGTGAHLWGQGPIPEHKSKNTKLGIELYHRLRFVALGKQHQGDMTQAEPGVAAVVERYFKPDEAGPGNHEGSGPRADWRGPVDDDELIRRALQSQSARSVFDAAGASFRDLWERNQDALARAYPSSGDAPFDASSADAALAAHLSFWTGGDSARIGRLMVRSALRRGKWDRPDYLPRTIAAAVSRQRDVLQDKPRHDATTAAIVPASNAPATLGACSFIEAAGGSIPAHIEIVEAKLRSPEAGVRLAFDEFLAQITIQYAGEATWRRIMDRDYARLRSDFGRRGFKPIAHEIMRSAVDLVAHENRFDSARDWARSLRWDGLPRVQSALERYFGVKDTPYARAVAMYLFTAMAARALDPGHQVDMVPILVGLQGERKSSAIRALCPDQSFFVEVNLKRIDEDDLSRHMRGKLVGEIAELRGLSTRDKESVKAFVTRRVEEWIPKYQEFEVRYPRRLVFIGTTNNHEILDDPTGERRWLPVEAGSADIDALERDRDQLWAEGVSLFEAGGVRWEAAQRLAREEHPKFKLADPWADAVETWLGAKDPTGQHANGARPFQLQDVALGALEKRIGHLSRADQLRLADVLRGLGFEKRDGRKPDGTVGKLWMRAGA